MTAGSPTVYPIPPPNADFATTWAFLKEGLDHIMTEPQTGMSYHKYMALSTASYNYCISPDPVRKFPQPTPLPHTLPSFPFALHPVQLTDGCTHEKTAGRADVNGSDLYKSLVGFLVTHLRTLKDVSFPNRQSARQFLTDPLPYSGVRTSPGRSAVAILRHGVGSVHEGSQLYQPIVHLSQPRVGEERNGRGQEGYLPRLYCASAPLLPHSFTVRTGIHVDHLIVFSPHADGD